MPKRLPRNSRLEFLVALLTKSDFTLVYPIPIRPLPRISSGMTFGQTNFELPANQDIIIYKVRINQGGQEKGVDVRLALDVVHLTYENRSDCGIIVSQDWDFDSAISLAKIIARNQSRALSFESAFPFDNNNTSPRGIPGTTWVHIDRVLYDSCHDPKDYRQ